MVVDCEKPHPALQWALLLQAAVLCHKATEKQSNELRLGNENTRFTPALYGPQPQCLLSSVIGQG